MSNSNYHLLSDNNTTRLLSSSTEEHFAPLETDRPYKRVPNLDVFLKKLYNYYHGKGFLCIFLTKSLNLLSLIWVIFLTTFLLSCVDYYILFESYDIQAATKFKGMHPILIISLIMFCSFWLWEFIRFIYETRENWEIKHFYDKELNVNGTDLQTIEWREVVQKIIKVPGLCISKNDEPMTALDIANRIMRQDNYMIAMVNQDIFHLEIPIPLLRGRTLLTKTIEWSLSYTIMKDIFGEKYIDGINKDYIDPANSHFLSQRLKQRFRSLGLLSLCLSPFILIFLIIYFFFKYGEEIRNHPSAFTVRHWSPLARWKFRELNELPHVFQKRLNASYEASEKYVNCFPSHLLTILARFTSFVIGSLLAVLILLGLWDDQALFKVELLEGRTAIWFLGVGGSIVAIFRGLIPNENTVMDPHKAMEEVVQHTHYLPKSWRGRVHSHKVYAEFIELFDYKISNFVMELLSVIFAPLILLSSLPNSADRIVTFFRENTVKEEGVGYVCRYAVFPVEELATSTYGLPSSLHRRSKLRQGKIEKSFLNFKANHPECKIPQGEKYLEIVQSHLSSPSLPTMGSYQFNPNASVYRPQTTMSDDGIEKPPMPTSLFTRDGQSLNDSIANLNMIHKYFYRSSLQGSDSKMS